MQQPAIGHDGAKRAVTLREIRIALQHMKAGRLPGMGLEPGTLNSDEFAAYYRSEIEKYARVVKGAGIPAMD